MNEGLLSGVLPAIYSASNRMKRGLLDFYQNPGASMEQTAGGLLDSHRRQSETMDKAFSNPERPLQITDEQALAQATDNMLTGPLGFAPVGMTAPTGRRQITIVTPNKTNESKLSLVKKEMEKRGPPKIRAFWDGEKYIAIEGSHRVQAAKELGMTPVIEEVQLRKFITDHDLSEVRRKASTNRILDYLDYGNHSGANYVRFDDF